MKLKIKLFIAAIFISIFIGFICAKIHIYKDNNTYYGKATILDSYVVYDSNKNVDGYLTILEYNGNVYRFSEKDIYEKTKLKINKTVDIKVCIYRFSNICSFLMDEEEITIIS